jgi:hypothetical protein
MAAIARRSWAELATETQRRAGGINYAGPPSFLTRVQYFLWASYLEICTKWYHHELFVLDATKTLSTSTNTLTLPTGVFILIAMALRNGTAYSGEVAVYSGSALLGAYTAESGKPTRRTRGKATIYLDKKPDIAYAVDLYYYKYPDAPDFSSGTPETGVDCDEAIISGALRYLNPAIGRSELGDVNRQLLVEWLSDNVRGHFVDEPLELRERMETDRKLGGPAQ